MDTHAERIRLSTGQSNPEVQVRVAASPERTSVKPADYSKVRVDASSIKGPKYGASGAAHRTDMR